MHYPLLGLKKYHKYDSTMRWFIAAIKLGINDIDTINYGQHLPITPYHHIRYDIPTIINIIPFDKPWNDNDMNKKHMHSSMPPYTIHILTATRGQIYMEMVEELLLFITNID